MLRSGLWAIFRRRELPAQKGTSSLWAPGRLPLLHWDGEDPTYHLTISPCSRKFFRFGRVCLRSGVPSPCWYLSCEERRATVSCSFFVRAQACVSRGTQKAGRGSASGMNRRRKVRAKERGFLQNCQS